MAVRGNPGDDARASLGDNAGGEEGEARPAELALAERLDRHVSAPERVLAQRAVLGNAELALEVMRDVLEVDAEPDLQFQLSTKQSGHCRA